MFESRLLFHTLHASHELFMHSYAFAVFHEFMLYLTCACSHYGCAGLFICVYIYGLCASTLVVSEWARVECLCCVFPNHSYGFAMMQVSI